MKVLLSKQGDPLELAVIEGLPCGLNRAAIEAASQWKLRPATTPDGEPVEIWRELELTFQLY